MHTHEIQVQLLQKPVLDFVNQAVDKGQASGVARLLHHTRLEEVDAVRRAWKWMWNWKCLCFFKLSTTNGEESIAFQNKCR
jgi:hypothetical protein